MFKLQEQFLENLKENRKSRYTIRNYERCINTFFKWYMKSENIDDIDIEDIRKIKHWDFKEFKNYMEEEKGYSRAYINNHIASLGSFYKYLSKFYDGLENEARKSGTMVEMLSEDSSQEFLELDEAKKLLDMADLDNKSLSKELNVRNRLIINLFLATGLRCSELTKLKFKNINIQTGSVLFYGKGNKERGLYISDRVMEIYKEWLFYRKNMFGVPKENEEYIFLSTKRTPISNMHINRIIKDYCKRAGIDKERLSSHKLRHTFATLMLHEAGLELEQVSELMGHSSCNTTKRYTNHVSKNVQILAKTSNPLFN